MDTVNRLYGGPTDRWVEACIEKMTSVGINAFGAWSSEHTFDHGVPYTDIVEFCEPKWICPDLEHDFTIRSAGVKLVDVFDPVWHETAVSLASEICAPQKDSRDLVGYFTANELGWGQPGTDAVWGGNEYAHDTKGKASLLQACLALGDGRPAGRKAWEFVLDRHGGSLDTVGRRWEMNLDSREELAELTAQGLVLGSDGFREDHASFSTLFATEYNRVTSQAIRAADPNHLILGTRFGAPPGRAVLEGFVPPYVDVISMNNYRDTFYERVDEYTLAGDHPVINGEFAWVSGYFTGPHGREPEHDSKVLALVREMGPKALARAFEHPNLAGYTWYRWVQKAHPTRGTSYGLVQFDDTLNTLNSELLREVHPRIDSIVGDA
jgi:hypothetical protein